MFRDSSSILKDYWRQLPKGTWTIWACNSIVVDKMECKTLEVTQGVKDMIDKDKNGSAQES